MSDPNFTVAPPAYIAEEMERRRAIANEMYEWVVKYSALGPLINREDYVRDYLNSLEPLTWTAGGTTYA